MKKTNVHFICLLPTYKGVQYVLIYPLARSQSIQPAVIKYIVKEKSDPHRNPAQHFAEELNIGKLLASNVTHASKRASVTTER